MARYVELLPLGAYKQVSQGRAFDPECDGVDPAAVGGLQRAADMARAKACLLYTSPSPRDL